MWCAQAVSQKMAAVSALTCHVALAARALAGSPVRLAAAVGWPNGAAPTPVRLLEAELALSHGADELEVTLPLGSLLRGDDDRLFTDLKAFAELAHSAGASLTTVVETERLDETRLATAVALAFLAGGDAIAPAAGLTSHAGVTSSGVRLCRTAAPTGAGVFVVSPESAPTDAASWLQAGADRVTISPRKAGPDSL